MSVTIERDGIVLRGWKGRHRLFFEEVRAARADGRALVVETAGGERLRARAPDAAALAATLAAITDGVAPALDRTTTVEDLRREIEHYLSLPGFHAPALLDYLLRAGAALGASDLHLEPAAGSLALALRIDGTLHPLGALDAHAARRTVGRLKALAHADVHVADRPQHGRVPVGADGEDARVEMVPTVGGEAAAVRFFDRLKGRRTLFALGLSAAEREALRAAIDAPEGLVVLAGPSGAGKTTTLYAALRHVIGARGATTRVVTVEDPVEHRIDGAVQLEADAVRGPAMADLLRSALRMDAGALVVGEVRDPATAALAVEAAHTGHLVLCTLHAPSAAAIVPRLVDLGADAAVLGRALRAAVAQRLLRTLCACRKGGACAGCGGSGYRGRAAVIEVAGATPPLAEAARARVTAGETDEAEVRRVLG